MKAVTMSNMETAIQSGNVFFVCVYVCVVVVVVVTAVQ